MKLHTGIYGGSIGVHLTTDYGSTYCSVCTTRYDEYFISGFQPIKIARCCVLMNIDELWPRHRDLGHESWLNKISSNSQLARTEGRKATQKICTPLHCSVVHVAQDIISPLPVHRCYPSRMASRMLESELVNIRQ